MAFDKELYKALKAGLADLTEPQNQALRLIWENPNVPVYNLPIKIGRQPSGYVWLAVGAGIKTKLWRRMPPQIKREVQPPGYLPFYVGLLVRLYTVEDRHQRRLKVFELHAEAVKALQELKIIGTKRDQPSPDYKRLDKMEDDEVPTGFSAPAERKRVNLAIIARRGQQKFREALLSAYGGRCAVTGCDERNVLEAAHIIGFRDRGRYEASNGILLRADWHTLFLIWACGRSILNASRLCFQLISRKKNMRNFAAAASPFQMTLGMLPAARHSKDAISAFERRHTRHDDLRINARCSQSHAPRNRPRYPKWSFSSALPLAPKI